MVFISFVHSKDNLNICGLLKPTGHRGGVFLHHLVGKQCKLHCKNQKKKKKRLLHIPPSTNLWLSQSFIVIYYLFHSSINCRKLKINATDSCSYIFQLAEWNALYRPILHIFVNSSVFLICLSIHSWGFPESVVTSHWFFL